MIPRSAESIQLSVRLLGGLRVGQKHHLLVRCRMGASLADLMKEIEFAYLKPADSLLRGVLLGETLVLVNNRHIRPEEAEALELHDGDVVSLLPPLAGG